jgi:hypothetical protein
MTTCCWGPRSALGMGLGSGLSEGPRLGSGERCRRLDPEKGSSLGSEKSCLLETEKGTRQWDDDLLLETLIGLRHGTLIGFERRTPIGIGREVFWPRTQGGSLALTRGGTSCLGPRRVPSSGMTTCCWGPRLVPNRRTLIGFEREIPIGIGARGVLAV